MTQPTPESATTPIKKPRVLFICTGNTARSQMGQAMRETASRLPPPDWNPA